MLAGYVKLPGHGLVRWLISESGTLVLGAHTWTCHRGYDLRTWRVERNRTSFWVRLSGDTLSHVRAVDVDLDAPATIPAPPPSGPRLAHPTMPLRRGRFVCQGVSR
jgi:hypothetical protein